MFANLLCGNTVVSCLKSYFPSSQIHAHAAMLNITHLFIVLLCLWRCGAHSSEQNIFLTLCVLRAYDTEKITAT